MAEAAEDAETPKRPILKIVALGAAVLVLLAVAVGATLFFTGFFNAPPAPSAEAQLEAAAASAAKPRPVEAKGEDGKGEPKMVSRSSPELTRFQHTYLELERELLANLTNSRKVMQVQVALMTRYDDRVFKNVKKHEFALRSVALDVMRKTTEADLAQPEFRKAIAESIRQEMNAVLEKFEDFGGIEEVYFTNFVVQ
jgi:flagellar FliL protein